MNSYIWKPMKMDPRNAVMEAQKRNCPIWPRWMADSASTMATLLMSSTKVLTEVMGMLSTSSAGPERLLPR